MNLLRDLPDASAAEITEALVARPGLHIERIVSSGQASPPGFWYDQDEAEWILLLSGAARLRFEDEPEARRLGPGDGSRSRRIGDTVSSGPTRTTRRFGSPSFIARRPNE